MKLCILLIDSLRPDHLGCYGYHKDTSPNIDSIAENGVAFTNAFAQSNWTYPAVYSMMTGKYPSVLDITSFDQKVYRKVNVLPEMLSQKGFHSGIFSNFKILLNPNSFCSHFNEMREVRLDHTALQIFHDWISAHKDSFLLFHIGEYVHEPFCASSEDVDIFLRDGKKTRERALASDVVKILTSKTTTGNSIRKVIGRINKRLCSLSEIDLEYLFACYDAGIHRVDRFVGEIYSILKEHQYLLVVCADHGQSFMEHGIFGHGLSLYNEVIRVPLIVDFNDCNRSQVTPTVQLMDLFPTVFDFLEFEHDCDSDATSFAPALTGGNLQNRISFSEGFPNIALVRDKYKLISSYSKFWTRGEIKRRFSKGRTRSSLRNVLSTALRFLPAKLYSLEDDNNETNNLRWLKRELCSDLEARIKRILADIQLNTLPSEDAKISEQTKRQLEALGYL